MKVKELIESLKNHDPEADVMVGYEQSDYWRTPVAERASSTRLETVAWHDGYQKWSLNVDDDDDKTCNAVVIQ